MGFQPWQREKKFKNSFKTIFLTLVIPFRDASIKSFVDIDLGGGFIVFPKPVYFPP